MRNVFKKIEYAKIIEKSLITRIHDSDSYFKIWYNYMPGDSNINHCIKHMSEVKRSERKNFSLFAYEYCMEDQLPLIIDKKHGELYSFKALFLKGKQKTFRRNNLTGPQFDKLIEQILNQENDAFFYNK